jgi:hypothetical protein
MEATEEDLGRMNEGPLVNMLGSVRKNAKRGKHRIEVTEATEATEEGFGRMIEGPVGEQAGFRPRKRRSGKGLAQRSRRPQRRDLGISASPGISRWRRAKSRVLSFFTNLHVVPRVLLSPELLSPELLTLLLHSPVLSKTDAGS